ncbi:hypothetical protein Pve01_71600 [Planomonospora venezuelensis]|uniref:ATP-dependent Clp protease ATP-binding subunit ClpC n=1 Tax=Planomonospora venezuelensis TaxID=1999 RepID=A0A841CZN2_PLAVE|nr:ATP-dependent Clp protease ATP-binding subunit ClpC [Planomonospora venezuelensis]GIN05502.1 hypothetical protein Pve01_71600 [Planomonospora venezuelensis]
MKGNSIPLSEAPVFERFTDRARRVVVLAQEEARRLNHNYIGTEHILLGLVGEDDGVAARTLQAFDVSLAQVRQEVEETIGQGSHGPPGHIPFTPRAKAVLELSLREALNLRHNYIGTEHILLGLIREGEGLAARVLTGQGLELGAVRAQVIELLHRGGRRHRGGSVEEAFFSGGPSSGARLDRIQESLDRIERRLDALGAPPDRGDPGRSEEPGEPGGPVAREG